MITPEQLILNLTKENLALKAELASTQQDVLDFEKLAIEWRKGYAQTVHQLKTEIENLRQSIWELEKENQVLKKRCSFE